MACWINVSGFIFFSLAPKKQRSKKKKKNNAWSQVRPFRHASHWIMYRSNRSFNIPPGHTLGIWHLCRPGEKGILLSESSSGWGIWFPCIRGGEFELHPRFHVKSLAWQAIMGDAVLEDCVEKIVRVVANWLRGEGLNKLCTVFEGI